jgi:hypothetical protein
MASTLHKTDQPVYVGEGLKPRTYEDCLAERKNPNPNPSGEINIPEGQEKMKEHIRRSQTLALKSLRREA